jgi:hypothetical protein
MRVGTRIIIDPQLRELIPPLRDEERQALEENIRRDGCRDPLVVWRGHDILLDGHHRYEICQQHGIDFAVTEVELADREAAADWIDANQLGRRNLTPDQAALLRGRRYNRLKKPRGGDRRSKGQNAPLNVASRLAGQHGVDPSTIKRDGRFADAVAKTRSLDPDIEHKVVSGKGPPKAAVIKAAELLERHPDRAREVLDGKRTNRPRRPRATPGGDGAAPQRGRRAREAQAPAGVFDVIVIDPPGRCGRSSATVGPIRPNSTTRP